MSPSIELARVCGCGGREQVLFVASLCCLTPMSSMHFWSPLHPLFKTLGGGLCLTYVLQSIGKEERLLKSCCIALRKVQLAYRVINCILRNATRPIVPPQHFSGWSGDKKCIEDIGFEQNAPKHAMKWSLMLFLIFWNFLDDPSEFDCVAFRFVAQITVSLFDESFNFRTHITVFANFPTITSATCAESEHIWTWTKPSAWRLLLCPVGLTTATPCCMVSQLRTCSSSKECSTVLPGWSSGLVALHLAPLFVTLSTDYSFPS